MTFTKRQRQTQVRFWVGLWIVSVLLFCAFAGTRCTPKPQPVPVPSVPVDPPGGSPKPAPPQTLNALSWEDGHAERKAWTDALKEELYGNVHTLAKASDTAKFCPGFSKLAEHERIHAFAELIVAMAIYESNWKPETNYTECSKSSATYGSRARYIEGKGYCMTGGHALDGGLVISRGLTQISLASALSYGCKGLSVPKDLNDPVKNLRCTVRILTRLVEKNGKLFFGSGHYWAVIKTSNPNNKIDKITKRTSAMPLCKGA